MEDIIRRKFFYNPVRDQVRDDLIKSEPGLIYDDSNRETTPATSRKRKRGEKEGI